MSRCLLQLVISQIHHSIDVSVSSPACSIPNSPLNSCLCVFSILFYPKFNTQLMSLCLLQLVLSQIHHSIDVSVSSPACSIPNSPLNSCPSPAYSIPNLPLNSYLGVIASLLYSKFPTEFMSFSSS